jgi:hypothetical protein
VLDVGSFSEVENESKHISDRKGKRNVARVDMTSNYLYCLNWAPSHPEGPGGKSAGCERATWDGESWKRLATPGISGDSAGTRTFCLVCVKANEKSFPAQGKKCPGASGFLSYCFSAIASQLLLLIASQSATLYLPPSHNRTRNKTAQTTHFFYIERFDEVPPRALYLCNSRKFV